MNTINPVEGQTLEDARLLFDMVLAENLAAKRMVAGWGGAKLKDFSDPSGWLGLWMLKAEINAMVLIGCRLWDVVYQASDKAAEGILPVNRDQIDLPQEIESTYTRQPIYDAITLPASIKYMLAHKGLADSIELSNNLIVSVPLEMPGYASTLDLGDCLPFPDEFACAGIMLSRFSLQAHLELAKIRAQRQSYPEMDIT